MRNNYNYIFVLKIRKVILMTVLVFLPIMLTGQTQAPSIQTGVTFQWAEPTQPTPASPATIASVTIDGTVYNTFVVPSIYEMTRLGPGTTPTNADSLNKIKENGIIVANGSDIPNWNTFALSAFQDKNLNHYFEAGKNGQDICGDFAAANSPTQTAQKQSIFYNPSIPANQDGVLAVTERNANNCFHIGIYGTPVGGGAEQLLGQTFVLNTSALFGPQVGPPDPNTDYWKSGRVVENNGTLGIALFYLSEIVPIGSKITKIEFTASTEDHGDGKFFLMQKYAVDQQLIQCLDQTYNGDLKTLNSAPDGSEYTLVSGPPASQGTLNLLTDGTYTFIPNPSFATGDVEFEYQLCLPVPNTSVCDTGNVKLMYVDLPPPPTYSITCNASNNFTLEVTSPIGSDPNEFEYSLNGGTYQTETTFSGLTEGSYILSAMSTFTGCESGSSGSLVEINLANLGLTGNVTDVSCPQDTTGSIVLTPSGGNLPYTYLWSNGTTTKDLTNIGPGTYNVTVTDANGCTIPGSYTIDPGDNIDPTITAPSDFTLDGCDTDDIASAPGGLAYSKTPVTITLAQLQNAFNGDGTADDTGGSGIKVISYLDSDPTGTCSKEVTRTYTIIDNCDNETSDIQLITIATPTLTISDIDGASTVDCIADATETFTMPAITDACGNTLTPSTAVITENPNPLTCEGTRTYTYTYTDCVGNTDDWAYVYTIDTPAFTVTDVDGASTVDCIADATETFALPTVTDVCGNTLTPSTAVITENPNPLTCEGTRTYIYTYTDCAGNTDDWAYVYTIDTPAFIISDVDGASTVDCIADATETFTLPTVIDACGNNLTPSAAVITENPNPLTCEGTRTYTYTYTDCAGNTDDWAYVYTIDTPAFTISDVDGASTVDCIADATETFALPTVIDVCGNTLTPSTAVITENPDPLTCEGTRTFTYTYTDCVGNTDEWAYVYTIDTPALTVSDIDGASTVECIADATETFTLPTVTDACGNTLTPSDAVITESSDPLACGGTRTYTYTYTDCVGNTDDWAYIYTIKDTIAPELTLPSNATAECSDDLTPIDFGVATATDNCDTNPVVTYVDTKIDGPCAGTFTIVRTWTATDACGNFVSADQSISTSDTTPPTFDQTDLPGNVVAECTDVPAPEVLTASDNCGNAVVTVEDVRTDGNCDNNYVIKRTYIATDDCGLTNTHIQTITIQDTTPPTFDQPLPEANIVVECDAIPDPENLTATDSCSSASVSVSDARTDGDCKNNYILARTWVAEDDCGNTTAFTQIITVQDTKAPEFVETLPGDITVECDAIPDAEDITATDNCGNAVVTVVDLRTNGDCPSNYVIARTWIATDECGLTTSYTQNITVQDTKAPTPTTVFDPILDVSCTDVPETPILEFVDNCSANVIVEFNETNTFDEIALQDYQIIRTWTVSDACNNKAVYTQTLNVTLDEIFSEVDAEDRCFEEGVVDLNNYLPSSLNTSGVWEMIEGNPDATLNGNIFDPTVLKLSEDFLPGSGGIDYKFRYSTTDMGCISITEVVMNIHADCVVLPCGENDIVISKAITPNGDGYNDTFDISGIDLCGFVAEVKVFNRWGALVYESNNYTLGSIETSGAKGDWDGSAPSSSIGAAGKLPNGTYYFIINLKNSGLSPLTGPVYLGTK